MSHFIRLRGPWEFSVAGTGVARRIEFPCDWPHVPAPEGAAVTFRRHFHLPTGLKPGDRVLIVLRWQSPHGAARLNGTGLNLAEQPDGSHHAEVTSQLLARNELMIELQTPSPALLRSGAPILEATLQIQPA